MAAKFLSGGTVIYADGAPVPRNTAAQQILGANVIIGRRYSRRPGLASSPHQRRLTISIQFGFLPTGYCLSWVSFPLVWSIE